MLPHDRVIRFNGKPVQFSSFRELLQQVGPGEAITIDVKRGGKDVRLVYQGETPKLEGVLFFDCQFVSAPVFFVMLLLLVATQPFIPPPLWRSIMVSLAGLAALTVTIVAEATLFAPYKWVWESKAIDRPPPPFLHFVLAATVILTGLALSLLGALRVRAFLLRRSLGGAAAKGAEQGAEGRSP